MLKFTNRVRELRKLNNLVADPKSRPLLVGIRGESGQGKTELTKEFSASHTNHPIIRIPLFAENGSQSRQAEVCEVAFHAFENEAKLNSKLGGLSVFKKHHSGLGRFATIVLSRIASKNKNPFSIFLTSTFEYIFGFKLDHRLKHLFDGSFLPIQIAYIEWQLAKKQWIIIIENAQLLDFTAIQLILFFLEVNPDIVIILEEAARPEDRSALIKFRTIFENARIQTAAIPLRNLSLDEYKAAADIPQNMHYLVDKIYNKSDANMRQLCDLVTQLKLNNVSGKMIAARQSSEHYDATADLLQELPSKCIILLAILKVLHKPVKVANVQFVLAVNSVRIREQFGDKLLNDVTFNKAIRFLRERKLVHSTGSTIEIAHDRVRRALSSDKYKAVCIVALNYCIEYFETLIFDGDEHEVFALENAIHLIFLYKASNKIDRFQNLINFFMDNIDRIDDYAELKGILESFRDNIAAKTTDLTIRHKLLSDISKLFFLMGDPTSCRASLDLMDQIYGNDRVRELMCLNMMNQSQTVLAWLSHNKNTDHTVSEGEYYFHLRNVEMIALRNFNRLDEARDIYSLILNNTSFSDLPEYGYFLRNSHTYYESKDSVELVEQSVSHFLDRGMIEDAGRSRAVLGMEYGRLGNFGKSQVTLDSASRSLQEYSREHHIILNNRAATFLLEGKHLDQANEYLRSAILTAELPLDSVCIRYNRVILYAQLDDRKRCFSAIADLEDTLVKWEFENRGPVKNSHFNISIAYHHFGERALADRHMKICMSEKRPHSQLWDFRFGNTTTVDRSWIVRAQCPFNVGYLSYWQYPVK